MVRFQRLTAPLFDLLLALAAVMVALGARQAWEPLGLIVGGVLLAGWAWLVLSQTPGGDAE